MKVSGWSRFWNLGTRKHWVIYGKSLFRGYTPNLTWPPCPTEETPTSCSSTFHPGTTTLILVRCMKEAINMWGKGSGKQACHHHPFPPHGSCGFWLTGLGLTPYSRHCNLAPWGHSTFKIGYLFMAEEQPCQIWMSGIVKSGSWGCYTTWPCVCHGATPVMGSQVYLHGTGAAIAGWGWGRLAVSVASKDVWRDILANTWPSMMTAWNFPLKIMSSIFFGSSIICLKRLHTHGLKAILGEESEKSSCPLTLY